MFLVKQGVRKMGMKSKFPRSVRKQQRKLWDHDTFLNYVENEEVDYAIYRIWRTRKMKFMNTETSGRA